MSNIFDFTGYWRRRQDERNTTDRHDWAEVQADRLAKRLECSMTERRIIASWLINSVLPTGHDPPLDWLEQWWRDSQVWPEEPGGREEGGDGTT